MILAIIQARLGSTRLPGKVLKKIHSKTILELVIERVKKAKMVDRVCVALPLTKENDILENVVRKAGALVFRGSESDVLARFYGAAKKYKAKDIVRICADCPLIDFNVIDQVIDFYIKGGFDYASNVHPPTFPDGLDVEVFNFKTLEKSHQEARLPEEREHVYPYFYKIQGTKIGNLANQDDFSKLRLTVDEQKDLDLICLLYDNLPEGFGLKEIIAFLAKNSHWLKINQSVKALPVSRWQKNE